MKASKMFGETLRAAPGNAEIESHHFLLRAGYIRQMAAGIFAHLPLAWRSLKKIEQLLRKEMAAINGQEFHLPLMYPADTWQKEGRQDLLAEALLRCKDPQGREMLLTAHHEAVAAMLCRAEIRSYRQLPQSLYHFQNSFREPSRIRGSLPLPRESLQKTAYAFARDAAEQQQQYLAHYHAYLRISAQVGLSLTAARSTGGQPAHELNYLSPLGEEQLAICETSGYMANLEVAQFAKKPFQEGKPRPLESIATPQTHTIATLCEYLEIAPQQTAKVVFYIGYFAAAQSEKLIIGVVRGDMEANEAQILNLSGAARLRPARPKEIQAAGCVPGFASPIGIDRSKALVLADALIAEEVNLVTGANIPDHHYLNSNCPRDYQPDIIGHIALAFAGAPCPLSGAPLGIRRGVRIARLFQAAPQTHDALSTFYLDETGVQQPVQMSSYSIDIGRLFACIAEAHHDKHGLCLPVSVAPYPVTLLSLKGDKQAIQTADSLYLQLQKAGIEVLYDDRNLSPGVKFSDADLRGIPIRLTVSGRSLKNGGVEIKQRTAQERSIISLENIIQVTQQNIDHLSEALQQKYQHPASGTLC